MTVLSKSDGNREELADIFIHYKALSVEIHEFSKVLNLE